MIQYLTSSELAEEFHTTPKVLRKFLRSNTPKEQCPGRGNRWSLPAGKRDINRLKRQFEAWEAEHTRTSA